MDAYQIVLQEYGRVLNAIAEELFNITGHEHTVDWSGDSIGAYIPLVFGGKLFLSVHTGKKLNYVDVRGEYPKGFEPYVKYGEQPNPAPIRFNLDHKIRTIMQRICTYIEAYQQVWSGCDHKRLEAEEQARNEYAVLVALAESLKGYMRPQAAYNGGEYLPKEEQRSLITIDHSQNACPGGYIVKVTVCGGYSVPGDVGVDLEIRVTPDHAADILRRMFTYGVPNEHNQVA